MSDPLPFPPQPDPRLPQHAPAAPHAGVVLQPQPVRTIQHSPGFRNLVHVGIFFAVGLPLILLARLLLAAHWISREETFGYSVAALMFFGTIINAFVLRRVPLFGKLIARPDEGHYNGLWTYPCSLAVCFLIFPLYAAFGAWAVLACGDGAASFGGRLVPGHKLPWNAQKTYAGLIVFVCCAVFGAYISLYLMPAMELKDGAFVPNEIWTPSFIWTLAVLASIAGAIVESLDSKIDDNVRVPFASALMLVFTVYFLTYSTAGLPEATHVTPDKLVYALAANAILGALVLIFRFADLPATLLGVGFGIVIYFYAGWQGYVLFVLFVGIGSELSKLGLEKKKLLHAAEPNEGRRGLKNVLANLLVAALCCGFYPPLHGRPTLLFAFAGAIAAAMADTASSEIGLLSPKQPWLITTFKSVPHGTNGAISLMGTLAAILGSALIAVTAWLTGFMQIAAGEHALSRLALAGLVTAIFLAGMLGTAIDSLLGATVEGKIKVIGKSAVNFVCTLTGALTAGVAAEIWLFFNR
ncbi:MAG TPA: DUF92 domain-containing protein [Planctomycetota bacterium]|nr:DUF92 domain-containing protein [Planctomycetota bacterium]